MCSKNGSLLADLERLSPEKGCELLHAKSLTCNLAKCLIEEHSDILHAQKSSVTKMEFKDQIWRIQISNNLSFESSNVYMATGSAPKLLPEIHQYTSSDCLTVDLDDALTPSKLKSLIGKDDIVAVIGSSHSAVLALKNLAELADRPIKIKNFCRSSLKYAVYMENWILYDNTGLKGIAAEWAKEYLEENKLPFLNRIMLNDSSKELEIYQKELKDCTKLIFAIGYERNPLPKIFFEEKQCSDKDIDYDKLNGQIELNDNGVRKPLEGLFGYGIAFPEKIIDPHGNQEYSVGLWKFMRYIKSVIVESSLKLINAA